MLVDAPFSVNPTPESRAAPAESVRQIAVRHIEKLVLVVFWLLILEGALRKWVAPQLAHYLFFVRDPFVVLLYWHAMRAQAFRRAGPWLAAGMAFAAVAPLLAFVQIASLGDSRMATIMAYGWRQYFLYLPLPFALAGAISEQFLWRFMRHAFLATIITAPLMFAQFHSPPSSVINRGIAEDEALQFKSVDFLDNLIRPSGTFTSTVGTSNLAASTLALLLAAWLVPASRRRISTWLLLLAAAATAVCLAVCGSRGAFVNSAIVVLFALLVGIVAPRAAVRGRALLIPMVLLVVGAVLYPILFPDALNATLGRFAAAQSLESSSSSLGILGRALHETVGFMSILGDAPLAGYGLGLGGNGRSFLGSDTGLLPTIFAESDWTRHIVDLGPVVGVLFILYRIAVTFDVFRRSIIATRRAADPLPLLLFGYLGIGLFDGQLTGHGTVGGFLWLYLGLCLASCRIALERPA